MLMITMRDAPAGEIVGSFGWAVPTDAVMTAAADRLVE